MSKNVWGAVLILLCLCVSLLAFAGCAPRTDQGSPTTVTTTTTAVVTTTSDTQSQTEQTTQGTEEIDIVLPLTQEPVVIKYLISDHVTNPISSDLLILKEIQERTNVFWDFIAVPSSGYSERFAITLASGDLPDVLYVDVKDGKTYGPEGAFLPLNDLFAEYGKNILAGIKERKVEREILADDGNIYMIPKFTEIIKPHSYMLRMDWMDKLNLEVPSTLDEYYNVLKAFKESGLGGSGTIPLALEGMGMLRAIFNTFRTENDFVLLDGSIKYGPATSQMLEALTFVNQLYKDDLIDREFMIVSRSQWEERVASGMAGAVCAASMRADVFTNILKNDDPEAIMMPIEPLKGPDGKQYVRGQSWLGAGTIALSNSTKHAELIVRQFDYVYSEEGRLLASYGIEGHTFNYVDSKPVYTEMMFDTEADLFRDYGIFGRRIPVNPIVEAGIDQLGETLEGVGIRLNIPHMTDYVPSLTFTSEELSTLKNIQTAVSDKKDEYLMRFITGDEPFSNWDKYMNEMRAAGLEQMLEIYNAAYIRFNK